MEQAGVRIDIGVLDGLSLRFGQEIQRVGERVFELAGRRFNINSPSNSARSSSRTWPGRTALPRKRQELSTAQDVLEQLAEHNEVQNWFWNIAISPSSSRIISTLYRF